MQYKQGRGKTRGLGRLNGRSSLARLLRALGSAWEPQLEQGRELLQGSTGNSAWFCPEWPGVH